MPDNRCDIYGDSRLAEHTATAVINGTPVNMKVCDYHHNIFETMPAEFYELGYTVTHEIEMRFLPAIPTGPGGPGPGGGGTFEVVILDDSSWGTYNEETGEMEGALTLENNQFGLYVYEQQGTLYLGDGESEMNVLSAGRQFVSMGMLGNIVNNLENLFHNPTRYFIALDTDGVPYYVEAGHLS